MDKAKKNAFSNHTGGNGFAFSTGDKTALSFRLSLQGLLFLLLLFYVLCWANPLVANEDSNNAIETYLFKCDADYPPFEYVEEGAPTGFNVEILNAVAQVMELPIHIEAGVWAQVRQEFQSGRIDGLTGFFFTEERSRFADFSIPHSTVTHALFVHENNPVSDIQELWNQRIAVQQGDVMHDYLIGREFGGTIITENTPADALRRLAQGECDAALLQRAQGLYLLHKLGLPHFKAVKTNLPPLHYCFAVTKGNNELLDQIDEGLRILKATGKYGEIHQQWLGVYDALPGSSYSFYLLIILGTVLALLALAGFYAWLLRRQVRLRTKALQESEDKYRSLFENSSEALLILADVILDCNETACELFGKSRELLIGVTPADLSPPLQPDGRSSEEAARAYIQEALTGNPQLFAWKHLGRNNEPFEAEIALRIIPISDEPVCIASVRDVSQRRKTEEAIKREQDLVHAIANTSPVGIILTDSAGVIVFANHQSERILRLSRREIVAHAYDTSLFHMVGINGESLTEDQMPFAQIVKSKGMVYDMRHAIFFENGERAILSASSAPLSDADGAFRGAIFTLEDITARIEEEQEREAHWRRTQRQQAAILHIARHESLSKGDIPETARHIVEKGAQALETERASMWLFTVNRDKLQCLVLYERTGEIFSSLPDIAAQDIPHYLKALEEGRHINAEDAVNDPRTAEMKDIYLMPNGISSLLDSPIRVAGVLVGVLCHEHVGTPRNWRPDEIQFSAELADQAAQVIAAHEHRKSEKERKNLEAQMQHVQKLESLGVLAGGIAHDFNNLLMAIIGNAELALMDILPSNPACKSVREIETVARRAADLCRQMLAYSGKGKFVVEPINLNEMIWETERMLEISISKRAALKYSLSEILPSVEGDASQLRQVLMNLVLNASEALGERNGTITISTGALHCDRAYLDNAYLKENLKEGIYVCLEIADTGEGMPPEITAKIFDPFFTTKFTGRGLGLAAVLGIVRGHHGAILVTSDPGKGTSFKALFPASDKKPDCQRGNALPESAWSGKGLILLVDDEQVLLAVAGKMLHRLGFTVLTAVNGCEALGLYRKYADEIRCVILDLTMPQMNGEECFRELRRIRENVKVLLSSGFNEPDATQHFVGMGLAGFIQKPYRFAELSAKLREILGE